MQHVFLMERWSADRVAGSFIECLQMALCVQRDRGCACFREQLFRCLQQRGAHMQMPPGSQNGQSSQMPVFFCGIFTVQTQTADGFFVVMGAQMQGL